MHKYTEKSVWYLWIQLYNKIIMVRSRHVYDYYFYNVNNNYPEKKI